jgi:hypothetical protein
MQKKAEALRDNIEGVSASKTTDKNTTVEISCEPLSVDDMDKGNEAVTEKNYGCETSVLAMAKLEISDPSAISGSSVTVTLSVPQILANDNIRVLHQKKSGDWEELNIVEVGSGYVTVTTTSFSPIVVVRLAKASATTPTYVYYTASSASADTASTNGAQTDSTASVSGHNGSSDTEQNVSAGTTDTATYGQGYSDGYAAGAASVKSTATTGTAATGTATTTNGTTSAGTTVVRTVGSTGGSNLSATSPKTGASLPALPILAVFAFVGILVCEKKAQNL